jgi:alanyl-tRNA synthetase
VETFGDYYPELKKHQSKIYEIIAEEEQAFSTMLSRGIKYFTELQEHLKVTGETTISGKDVFFLYDTMGFPLDLTQQMATEAGFTVDTEGFTKEMDAQKQRSRMAARTANLQAGDGEHIPQLALIAEQTAWLSTQNIPMTDDSHKYLWDVEIDAQVRAIYGPDGNFFHDSVPAKEGAIIGLILDKSSFYAEAGGQVADTGFIDILNDIDGHVEASLEVKNVQTFGGFLVHTGIVRKGSISVGNSARSRVNYDRRRDIAPNHTMTHVLNAALRSVLGDGVEQRGSLCNEDKLRFDFTYKKAMSIEQLRQTEEFVQRVISNKEDVSSKVMPLAEARSINGVRAVFGETYPDPVRVVTIGDDTSIEFCGGTHLSNSAEAEAFALVEESAVAKGIRRISGVTKEAAKQAAEEGTKFSTLVASVEGKNSGANVMEDLDKVAGALRKDLDAAFLSASLKAELRARIEALQKIGAEAKKSQLQQRTDTCLNDVKEQIKTTNASGKNTLVVYTDIGGDAKASQRIINTVKELAPNMAFMGISEEEPGSGGKLLCYAVVPDSMVANGFRADQWVQAALATCGGRGGGKANIAQGQAKDCKDINQVLSEGNAYANMNNM